MGRHGRSRRLGRSAWVPLLVVAALVAGLAAGYLYRQRSSTDSRADGRSSASPTTRLATAPGGTSTNGQSGACAGTKSSAPTVRIAAASGIAPVITRVAQAACIRITERTTDSDAVGAGLLKAGSIDVWVPDSGFSAAAAGVTGAARQPSNARSPVVLLAAPSVAKALTAHGPFNLGALLKPSNLPNLTVAVQDPRSSAAVFAIAGPLSQIAIGALHDRYLGLGATAQALRTVTALDPSALRQAVPTSQLRVAEQRFSRDPSGGASLGAVVGTTTPIPALDYPWIQAPSPRAPQSLAALLTALRGSAGRQARAAAGLLEPSAATTSASVGTDTVQDALSPAPSIAEISTDLLLGNVIPLRGRALAVVDVSGSMGVSTSGPTPMDVVKQSVPYILNSVTPNTTLEIWRFGFHLDGLRDYQVLAPMTPLSTHRTELNRIIASLHAQATGTGLYNTTLAAYEEAQNNFDPDGGNIVAIFTDGRNQDASGLDLDRLIAKLRQIADPTKPVSLLMFGYGAADIPAMKQIVDAVDGSVLPIHQPQQMVGALIDAVSKTVQAGLA